MLTVFISDGNLFYTKRTMQPSELHEDYNAYMRIMEMTLEAVTSSGHEWTYCINRLFDKGGKTNTHASLNGSFP